MNQTFNFSRFSNLFIKHTVDNYKTYLMAFFVLLGVLFLSMGFAACKWRANLNRSSDSIFYFWTPSSWLHLYKHCIFRSRE